MEKKVLRQNMIKIRDEIKKENRIVADLDIKNKLINTSFYQKSKNIFIYIGFGSEIDTAVYINKFLKDGKRIFVPRVSDKSRIMEAVEITSLEDLIKNKYGILEPSCEISAANKELIDLVILPGVAFDERGGRLGYGGGYYDTFLQDISMNVVKIALAYELQIINSIPLEEHDIKADYIITEKREISVYLT